LAGDHAMLVLGGARSGKSRHALAVAESTGLRPVMLATARAGDAEMAARVERHRRERGPRWRAVEEPLDIVGALRANRAPDAVVVVDCLTLWLSNLMEARADIARASSSLCEELARAAGPLVMVSNEVGQGLAPMNALGREFRDEQGFLNQAVARVCGRVVLMAAGLPVELKPAVQRPFP